MHPPVVTTIKQSPKDGIELRGHHIPEGTDISVNSALHLVYTCLCFINDFSFLVQ